MLTKLHEKLAYLIKHAKVSLLTYTLFSYLVYALLVNYAVLSQPSWFRVLYFLCYKKVAVLLLGNAAGATAAVIGQALLRCTLGQLRDLETESLIEAGKTMLLDIILFLVLASPTVNGAEVYDGLLLFCLSLLLGVKLLHFVATSRTTHLMEAGVNGPQSIGKLAAFVLTLAAFDAIMVYTFQSVASLQSNFFLWMLFEFLGVMLSASANIFKLSIIFVDASLEATDPNDHGWPLKNEFIFMTEVLRDLTELTLFLTFLACFFLSNPARLPVYLANDLYQVARALVTRLQAFNRYRKLSSRLDTDFPNATLAELCEADNCIICRDLLTIGSKRLPCGHVLHLECLRSWFVHHQTCPTCRAEVPLPSAQPDAAPEAPAAPPAAAAPQSAPEPAASYSGETVVRGTEVTTLRPTTTGNSPNVLNRTVSLRNDRLKRNQELLENLSELLLEDAKLRIELGKLKEAATTPAT